MLDTLGSVSFVTDPPEPLHRFTVDDYARMWETGVLGEEDRVELLDGVIVEMESEGPAHANVVARLLRFFVIGLADEASLLVRPGNPIRLPKWSQPKPDVAVVDAADSTWEAHPERAHLLIEVSMTSLRKDRIRKGRIYARSGVPEYWIFDLVNVCVHVHRDPAGDAYTSIETFYPPAELKTLSLPLPPVPLGELLSSR